MNSFNGLKALILAAGRGRRLLKHTEEINKAMLIFNNKHMIEYSLENALVMDSQEIVIVVGYKAKQVMDFVGSSYKNIPVRYVLQREQKGVVHAIECSKSTIAERNFVLMLADEFFLCPDHPAFVNYFYNENAFAVCGIVHVSNRKRIMKTYSVHADACSQKIAQLIEKPKYPINDIMGTGNILFRNDIFHYVPSTPINPQRGERELPDLIQCAINDNQKVLYFSLAKGYININTTEDLLELEKNVINH